MVSRITEWNIESTVTLSDHLYISMTLESATNAPTGSSGPRSWNFKKLSQEVFAEALEWKCAAVPVEDTSSFSGLKWVTWLDTAMMEACDLAAPRFKGRNRKRSTYWWNENLAEIRKECVVKQRAWTKSKRRSSPEVIEELRRDYRAETKRLRKEIHKAKQEALRELIATIDEDPWGLPYKIVLRKLRKPTLGLTETLDRDNLDMLVTLLFPEGDTQLNRTDWSDWTWKEEHQIIPGEVHRLLKKRSSKIRPQG
ncbi:uncharacterized protein LOC115239476 [Formica exsecta]|uniref:uncharacterized protein LOC115239476 n=1 Tax=Formica exsecta TaxID=72781 RepID=UPI0011438ACA|nr:uncharacterized protein LOC115239476 [Formica exsecta]